ncbi:MAG: cell division protein FtsA [Planctomycetales bacterium 4484_113]|nr:MAG: cell division protein FtsA [Planctomycetales bacterium 4484_113]
MAARIIAGIDLGSSKITSVIAELARDEIIVRGINWTPAKSIVKGVVRDLNLCAREVNASFSGAVYSSGVHAEEVHLAFTCKDLTSVPLEGSIRLSGVEHEITQEDVEQLMNSLEPPSRHQEYERLQRIVQEFIVNETDGVRDPVGMFGEVLAVRAQDVLGPPWLLANYKKVLERVGLEAKSLVPSVLAAGRAVLTEEEMNTGCVLLDLGHGTTDIALYREGSPLFTATIPIGGSNIDVDLMEGLGVNLEEAQRVKKSFVKAWVQADAADADEVVDIKFFGHREYAKIKKQKIYEIVLPRLAEWAELIKERLYSSGYMHTIPGGVVVTGGGAYMREVTSFFTHHLSKPVRIGVPRGFSHLFEEFRAPQFASALGIAAFAAFMAEESRSEPYPLTLLEEIGRFFGDLWGSLPWAQKRNHEGK